MTESNCSRCGRALKPSFADRERPGEAGFIGRPFKCHICGREFAPTFTEPNGGICSRCGLPTCERCLVKTHLLSIPHRPPLCKPCARSS